MKPIPLVLSLIFFGFSVTNTAAQNFNQVLRSELSSSNPGVLFTIESGDGKLSWSGAAGINDRKLGDSLQVIRTFRIASVTKTYVAAAILRLMEKKVLRLEDPISKHLSPAHAAILAQDYDLKQITIQQILRHSAGFLTIPMPLNSSVRYSLLLTTSGLEPPNSNWGLRKGIRSALQAISLAIRIWAM